MKAFILLILGTFLISCTEKNFNEAKQFDSNANDALIPSDSTFLRSVDGFGGESTADGMIRCNSEFAQLDSNYVNIPAGGSYSQVINLSDLCSSLYTSDDSYIGVIVNINPDPRWFINKDNLAINNLRLEVIDMLSGKNLVSLLESEGLAACNSGRGLVFHGLKQMPMLLRPIKVIISNLSTQKRNSIQVSFSASYLNSDSISPTCTNYPTTK